jgi:hypothetical protein
MFGICPFESRSRKTGQTLRIATLAELHAAGDLTRDQADKPRKLRQREPYDGVTIFPAAWRMERLIPNRLLKSGVPRDSLLRKSSVLTPSRYLELPAAWT